MTPEGMPRADGSAFCVAHRLRYDPQLHIGCVLCQRSLTPSTPPPQRGVLVPLLLGTWFGVVAVFGYELVPLVLSGPEPMPVPAESVAHAAATAHVRQERRPAPSAVPQQQRAKPAAADDWVPPVPPDAPSTGLSGAAARGDVAGIAAQLAANAPIDAQDGHGYTALAWAIVAQRPDAARLLIERGAKLELADHAALTPLMLASQRGLEAVTALLLERGAKVETATARGETALMLAAEAGHTGVVDGLLAHHAPVEARDDAGRSALMRAAAAGAPLETIKLLLAHDAALEGRDMAGMTPLLHAAASGREAVTGLLLERGAALTARAHNGWGALDFVVQPRPGADDRALTALAATLQLLIRRHVEPQLAIDAAHTAIALRPVLDDWYARIGHPPLPAFEGAPQDTIAAGASASGGEQLQDSPATLLVFEPKDVISTGGPAQSVPSALVGYHGWTRVPEIRARVVVRGLSLYGGQRATLCGDARGDGGFHVEDVLLLEVMQAGELIDIGFASAFDGVEVAQKGVKRMGDDSFDQRAGTIDLTPWLSSDGRELVLTVLAASKHVELSNVYLRVNGAGARRTVQHAEVDHSGQGGTL